MTAPSADDLRARLTDPDQAVRFNAALELAKGGDPAAAPALIEALVHPSEVVRRRYAGGALAELGAATLPDLRAALDAAGPSFELAHGEEWVSRAPVRPLARVPVEPRDFPFLDRINASDWRLGGTWPTFEGTPYLDWRRIRPILT